MYSGRYVYDIMGEAVCLDSTSNNVLITTNFVMLIFSYNRLSCQNSELLHKIAGLALQCELPETITVLRGSLITQLIKFIY